MNEHRKKLLTSIGFGVSNPVGGDVSDNRVGKILRKARKLQGIYEHIADATN